MDYFPRCKSKFDFDSSDFSTFFKGVPRTDNPDLVAAYGNPVLIRNWQIYGLPRDGLSTENAVITQYTKRWPLFIDPQGQANKVGFQIDVPNL